ncbi:MAG: PilZ domain-containing protein [Deltaproteobacteria bacterium]|nr:PilZ domain-containing protein [Deltaproteobacteria bacterium]
MSKENKVPGEAYNFDEELQYWKKEYLELKKQAAEPMSDTPEQLKEAPDTQQSGSDRRSEPRYIFGDQSKIYAHLGPRAFRVLNISVGGLAFHSDLAFEPGTKLLMSALGMIALDVEVLSCIIEETDAGLMEYKYRVRAKFGPRVNGYQVYVLAREMYLQEGGEDHKIMFDSQDDPSSQDLDK